MADIQEDEFDELVLGKGQTSKVAPTVSAPEVESDEHTSVPSHGAKGKKGKKQTERDGAAVVDGVLVSSGGDPEIPLAPVAGTEPPAEIKNALTESPTIYTVDRNTTVAWKGQMIRLRAGQEVADSSYGPGAVEKFKNAGVPLTPK